MQTVAYSLPELLRRIKGDSFRIPQFQRDFRWTGAQVKLLIDSIARNYPMGSLLVLARNPDIPLESRSIKAQIKSDDTEAFEPEEHQNDTVDAYYVLDGQQRLTSMARVLLNADPTRSYYFDLKEMVESFWTKEDTGWIKARRRGKREHERKESNRLMRADVVLDQQKADIYVTEYIEDSDDFPHFADNRQEARKTAAMIKGIFETIRKYQVPVVILDREAGLESVCRVFETINSTGTRLTTFDLAVARFYPEPDLRTMWEEAREHNPVIDEFEVDGERVLQVLVLKRAEEHGRADEPTRNSQLQLPKEYVSGNWSVASECLAAAYKWAREHGATPKTLPNHGLLASLAAHWCGRPGSEIDELMLRRWFYSHLLQPGSAQAVNYKIRKHYLDLGDISLLRTDGFPSVSLVPNTIVRLNKSHDSRFKALQCMMALTVSEDLISGVRLDNGEIEYHHIFPKALNRSNTFSKSKKAELESVANRIALSKESNRELGDTPPLEYFRRVRDQAVESGTLPGLQHRLKAALIPGDIDDEEAFLKQFQPKYFSQFIRNRAELIHTHVRTIIGESLIASEQDDFDDEA